MLCVLPLGCETGDNTVVENCKLIVICGGKEIDFGTHHRDEGSHDFLGSKPDIDGEMCHFGEFQHPPVFFNCRGGADCEVCVEGSEVADSFVNFVFKIWV